jgi:hypothetical protein
VAGRDTTRYFRDFSTVSGRHSRTPPGTLLSVTKSLNSFRWFWYYNPNIYNPSNASVIELDQIASALLHVQDTLTECTISAECDYRYGEGDFPALEIKGSLQSLSGFDSLKNLEIPLLFLLGFSP